MNEISPIMSNEQIALIIYITFVLIIVGYLIWSWER